MSYKLIQASAHDTSLPDKSVHCIVTSPPYYGLRAYAGEQDIEWPAMDYKPMPGLLPMPVYRMTCALGAEPTPEAFIGHLILVMREMWRVLRDDGTAFINLGDSYATGQKGGIKSHEGDKSFTNKGGLGIPKVKLDHGLKDKDLMLIPYRFALAAQADGWYVRSDIIWHKRAPMPESVTDRCTKAHEYIYMLAKQESYFFDNVAIQEESTGQKGKAASFKRETKDHVIPNQLFAQHRANREDTEDTGTRNRRSVWSLTPSSFPGAHFATFPIELPLTCIKAGTSEHGVCEKCGAPWEREIEKESSGSHLGKVAGDNGVLRNDLAKHAGRIGETQSITTGWAPTCTCFAAIIPATVADFFNGSGTTGRAALQLNRSYVGVDISKDYLDNLCEDDNRAAAGLPKLLKGDDVDLSAMPLWAEATP